MASKITASLSFLMNSDILSDIPQSGGNGRSLTPCSAGVAANSGDESNLIIVIKINMHQSTPDTSKSFIEPIHNSRGCDRDSLAWRSATWTRAKHV